MNVDIKLKSHKIAGYLLALIVFFLPLKAQYSTVFIILSLIAILPVTDWKNFWLQLKQNKFFIICIAYFTMHVIGILYSDNLKYAFNDVQTKFSFLIFPVLFTAFKPDQNQFAFIKRSFILGCIVALIICTIKSLIEFRTTNNSDVFFYEQFSHFIHTTYFSFYLNVALLFLIDEAYKKEKQNSIGFKTLFFIIEMVLLIGIFLLSARMALLTMTFTIVLFVIIKAIQHRDKQRFTIALFISFIIAGGIQFKLNSLYNRFTQIENTVVNEKQITNEIQNNKAKPEIYNSTTSRIALWKYAMELITNSPLNTLIGVGTGDIKDELMKVYVKHKFQKGIDENYNPHNQFLHTAVVIGVIGLLILLLLLLYPLHISLMSYFWSLSIFLLIILFNSLTESILEVQSGIIFFCFFYCLLISEMKIHQSSSQSITQVNNR